LAGNDGDTMDAIGSAIAIFHPDLRVPVGSEASKRTRILPVSALAETAWMPSIATSLASRCRFRDSERYSPSTL
jgi:hypothetical protein